MPIYMVEWLEKKYKEFFAVSNFFQRMRLMSSDVSPWIGSQEKKASQIFSLLTIHQGLLNLEEMAWPLYEEVS